MKQKDQIQIRDSVFIEFGLDLKFNFSVMIGLGATVVLPSGVIVPNIGNKVKTETAFLSSSLYCSVNNCLCNSEPHRIKVG